MWIEIQRCILKIVYFQMKINVIQGFEKNYMPGGFWILGDRNGLKILVSKPEIGVFVIINF